MMPTAPVVLTILVAALATPRAHAFVEGPGALLPLQDRTGDSELGLHVENALRDELSLASVSLVDARRVRNALRRQRIRFVDIAPPHELDRLAEDLGATWLLSATLHAASVGEVPRITLSARLYVAGRATLAWAGFESADGLDQRRLLDLGVIADFDMLTQDVLRRLVSDLGQSGGDLRRSHGRGSPDRGGYLRESITAERLGVVAVIPFDSVAERDPSGTAETVTSLTLAVLHRRGVPVIVPGAVSQALRARGHLWRGAVNDVTRASLGEATGADTILTGTVETYSLRGLAQGGGPVVSISGLLLDVGSGRILWINGYERNGARAGGAFGTGRIRDPATLAEGVVESLVGGFLSPTHRTNIEVKP